MKKIILYILCICTTISLFGCTNKGEQNLSITPEENKTLMEEYYNVHPKLNGSIIYSSDSDEFCMQIPKDAKIDNNKSMYKEYGQIFSFSSSVGDVAVRVNDSKPYTSKSQEEIEQGYSNEKNKIAYKITDFEIIKGDDNEEIGRKYIVTLLESGEVMAITYEFKYNNGVIRLTGNSDIENKNELMKYMDSFVIEKM